MIFAARHVHHLLDGCILTTQLDRPLHVLVAVDWAKPGPRRRLLDLATNILRWPTVIRGASPSAAPRDARRRLSAATRECVALLREGKALLIFPEGYPIVDPHPTPKTTLDDFLPFRPGSIRLATYAAQAGGADIPIVPVGFWYAGLPARKWRVILRFGEPLQANHFPSANIAAATLEARVKALSGPPDPTGGD